MTDAGQAANPPATRSTPSLRPEHLVGLLVPLLGLLCWEILSRTGQLPANWMPAPSALVRTIVGLARSGELPIHLAVTLARVAAGFVLGSVLGTVFGALAGESQPFRRLVDPTIQALRSVPSMAWAPLFLLWMGIGEASKVALIGAGVFFPVYLNLTEGILQVDRKLREVGMLHGYRGIHFVLRVLMPAVLPSYVVGLRSGLGLGWMFVVAAEIVGASRGLGYLMVDGETTSRPELILASLICFAILGKATDALLGGLAGRLLRWKSD